MALDLLNGKVRVYNYETSPVGFPSHHTAQGVFINGRDDEEEFVVERVSFDDVETENTKSDLFKVGRLRFHPDEETEIYVKLGIEDKDNILSDADLISVLQNDSVETIKWISNLKSPTLLLRMKSLLFKMEQNDQKIPRNTLAVVTERSSEIRYGHKRHANSEINRILTSDKKAKEEDQLQKKLSTLEAKFEQLEREKLESDKNLLNSNTALQDLLKIVEDLKSASLDEKKQTTKSAKTEKSSKKNK